MLARKTGLLQIIWPRVRSCSSGWSNSYAPAKKAYASRHWSSLPLRSGSQYRYHPLAENEIRLLHLLPGDFHDEVRCGLVHTKLPSADEKEASPAQTYEALSYAWGDLENRARISCSSEDLFITENLYSALRHLRLTTETRRIWVDAICINQPNVVERNTQIQRMKDVYSQAKRVLIWLGEETDEVKGALANLPSWLLMGRVAINNSDLRMIKPLPKFRFTIVGGLPSHQITETMRSQDFAVWLEMQRQYLAPIAHLLARQWWRRKWIVQEFISARDALFICGFSTQKWENILAAYISSTKPNAFDRGFIKVLDKMRPLMGWRERRTCQDAIMGIQLLGRLAAWHIDVSYGQSPTRADNRQIQTAIRDTRDFLCSEPRDHLYGILSFATDVTKENLSGILIDYSASLDSISQSFSVWCTRHGSYSLWHLGRVVGVRRSKTRLLRFIAKHLPWTSSLPSWTYNIVPPGTSGHFPSWIVNNIPYVVSERLQYLWHRVYFDKLRWCFSEVASFDAGRLDRYPRAVCTFSEDEKIMHVRGKIVDTVAVAYRFLKKGSVRSYRYRGGFRRAEAWLIWISYLIETHTETGGPILEVLYELMTYSTKEVGYHVFVEYIDLVSEIAHGRAESSVLSGNPSFHKIELLIQKIEGRKFGITTAGRIYWLPAKAKKGDRICVLHGGKVPYVIDEFDKNQFTLVGESYVMGFMHGEALDSDQIEDQIISLN